MERPSGGLDGGRRPAFASVGGEKLSPTVTIVSFGADGKDPGKAVVPRVVKTEAQWKQQLSPLAYNVARQAGTERPYTADNLGEHQKGLFRCVCCEAALFRSETKFDSGTGWPSF